MDDRMSGIRSNGDGAVRENGDAVSWDELRALGSDGQPKTVRTYLAHPGTPSRTRTDTQDAVAWEEFRATDEDGKPKVVETYTVDAGLPVDIRVMPYGEWRDIGLRDVEGGFSKLPPEVRCDVLDRCLIEPSPPGGWTPERLDSLDWAAPDDLVATVATRSRAPNRLGGAVAVDIRVASYGLYRRHGLLDEPDTSILDLDVDQKAEFLDACVEAPRPPDGYTAEIVEEHLDWRSPDDLLLTIAVRSRSNYRNSIPPVQRVDEGKAEAASS